MANMSEMKIYSFFTCLTTLKNVVSLIYKRKKIANTFCQRKRSSIELFELNFQPFVIACLVCFKRKVSALTWMI